MDTFITVNGKKLRCGYTTGACAAAAAKAALTAVVTGDCPCAVTITLPEGKEFSIPVESCHVSGVGEGSATVRKDGGDDIDVTHGIRIIATVKLRDDGQIRITGGEGVGKVTRRGLKIPPGGAAINPGPLQMITQAAKASLNGRGAEITIQVPDGETIAQKTLNPKLGIVGGISILGTTGIVRPMSEEALRESLALTLSILCSSGTTACAFVFGNYGTAFAENVLCIPKDKIICTSNFIGFMLDTAVQHGMERLLIVGHIGKMVKLSAGVFHTHNRIADARMETLACYCALCGAPQPLIRQVYGCKTTQEANEVICAAGLQRSVFQLVGESCLRRCRERTGGKLEIACVLFENGGKLLYQSEDAGIITEELKRE